MITQDFINRLTGLFISKGFNRVYVQDTINIILSKEIKATSYEAYVKKAVHNRLLNRVRREGFYLGGLDLDRLVGASAATAETKMIEQERLLEVDNAIKNLCKGSREVIELRYKKGLTHKEIASKLNKNYNTVKSLDLRGIKLLRENLKHLA